MYHITKTKSGFQVVLVGKNGEPLSVSESFPSKQKAYGNVMAQINAAGESSCSFLQDDTLNNLKVIRLWGDGGRDATSINPSTRYIPGKNPKKKKK